MDYITKEIIKKFGEKYNFLKLLEVVYDLEKQTCKVVFLYPENMFDIEESVKQEISSFVESLLSLNAKLEVKFKKSFLDEELILKHVNEYFKVNNFSLFANLKSENILAKRNGSQVEITLNFSKDLFDYVEENNIVWKLKENLEKNFFATFFVELNKTQEQIDQSVLDKRKNTIPEEFSILKPVARYQVLSPQIIIGKEITPQPEFISNQTTEKTSVILAGKISNFQRKEYKSKKSKNSDETKAFYTFDLTDITGTIPCVHFAAKSNEPKLNKLSGGAQVVAVGDIRPNMYGKLTYYIRSLSYCLIDDQVALSMKEQSEKEEVVLKGRYQYVFPKSYVSAQQTNLFEAGNEYNDLILNNSIISFDVETTGLEADISEIIEIGAAKIVNGEIVETFQTLVKPKKEIPTVITEITGINNEMVKDAPTINQAIADFILFVGDSILTGYNVTFDMRFIQKAASEIGYKFNNRVEDCMVHAKSKLFLSNYTLKSVAKSLNVSLKEAHRALNDALATAKVFLLLNKK